MLSYQHAYHAGNQADLHKHMVLAELLTFLTQKPRPITYIETHAGRGLYDLASPEALKTGEAEFGIGTAKGGDHPYFEIIDEIRERHGASAYPGSPLIAQSMLRPIDQLHLFELHPQEHAALKSNLAAPNTSVHFRDGFTGVLALSPPKSNAGLVLIDPSYEVKTEYALTGLFALDLAKLWPKATIVIWYPILPAARHHELLSIVSPLNPFVDEYHFGDKNQRGMSGSGLILINPVPGADQQLARVRALLGHT